MSSFGGKVSNQRTLDICGLLLGAADTEQDRLGCSLFCACGGTDVCECADFHRFVLVCGARFQITCVLQGCPVHCDIVCGVAAGT